MALKTNSADGGSNGVAVTTANSGGGSGDALAVVTPGAGGTVNFSSATPAHGSLCYELTQATAANLCHVALDDTASASFAVRFYLRISGLPSVEAQFPFAARTAADASVFRIQMGATGVTRLTNSLGAVVYTGTVVPSLNTWYRYELTGTGMGTSSATIFYALYLGDSSTPLESTTLTSQDATNGTIGRLRYGKGSTATLAVWKFDSIAQNIGSSTPLGPYGGDPATGGSFLRGGDSLRADSPVAAEPPEEPPEEPPVIVSPGDGLTVQVDWNRDGDFTDPLEDVTGDVRAGYGVTVEYGRDQSTALSPTVAGRGAVVLGNTTRRYSPRNTASPLYGSMKPARPVRFQRTVAGTTYALFVGHTDDSPINPDLDSRTVSLSLVDSLADFRGQTISTPLYAGLRTGDAVGYVLDAAGWTGGRDLDAGATFIPWWWEDGTDALDALEKLIRSEGPPALLTVGVDGSIVFRDRHHRLTEAASLTSQGTWRGTPDAAEPVMGVPFTYDEAWRGIVNDCRLSVDVRIPGSRVTEVWTSEATITLTDGETKAITAQASDPFMAAVTPEAGTDFDLVGAVAVALTRDSGLSTTIRLTASGGPATVTGLRLRAMPIPVSYAVQVSARDSASVGDYGSRGYPGDLPWCNQYDAQAVLDATVAQRAMPLPVVSVRFMVGTNAARAAKVLSRDIGDRVTVIEPETALSGDFYIESIRHDFTGEHDHSVTFGLEAAPTPVSPVFRFGITGAGFGEGKFGSGIDDPANMFRFDGTVGHRFTEGAFAQ